MTAAKFRILALAFPETEESSHMGHPDFRVRGKIFATLGADESWAMVKLTPMQQAEFQKANPTIGQPAAGAWGRRGATIVKLRAATTRTIAVAIEQAWRNTAPKTLAREYDLG